MRYNLYVEPSARRQLKNLSESEQVAIRRNLMVLCETPFNSILDIRKLSTENTFQLVVRAYKITYTASNGTLVVQSVE